LWPVFVGIFLIFCFCGFSGDNNWGWSCDEILKGDFEGVFGSFRKEV
jgi:hypothetical protein